MILCICRRSHTICVVKNDDVQLFHVENIHHPERCKLFWCANKNVKIEIGDKGPFEPHCHANSSIGICKKFAEVHSRVNCGFIAVDYVDSLCIIFTKINAIEYCCTSDQCFSNPMVSGDGNIFIFT